MAHPVKKANAIARKQNGDRILQKAAKDAKGGTGLLKQSLRDRTRCGSQSRGLETRPVRMSNVIGRFGFISQLSVDLGSDHRSRRQDLAGTFLDRKESKILSR
jgi:hypothetical protein